MRIAVTEDFELKVDASPSVAAMYHLSPYAWTEHGRYSMLLRVVNRSDIAAEKVARIHFARSDNGLCFAIEDHPVLAPGPGLDDIGGCEDPTVVRENGKYLVYYTGWNEQRKEANLLLAEGDDVHVLRKLGIALHSSDEFRNPKEATLQQISAEWRLFFEYSRHDRSWIGLAQSNGAGGPWNVLADPITTKAGAWDSGMLSPGPLVRIGQRSVMFYNGATDDDHWEIGWILFDEQGRVLDRCEKAIIHGSRPEPGTRSMAFASSAIVQDPSTVWLYYSVADMQMRRATVLLG